MKNIRRANPFAREDRREDRMRQQARFVTSENGPRRCWRYRLVTMQPRQRRAKP